MKKKNHYRTIPSVSELEYINTFNAIITAKVKEDLIKLHKFDKRTKNILIEALQQFKNIKDKNGNPICVLEICVDDNIEDMDTDFNIFNMAATPRDYSQTYNAINDKTEVQFVRGMETGSGSMYYFIKVLNSDGIRDDVQAMCLTTKMIIE